jgi:hypothetical protein
MGNNIISTLFILLLMIVSPAHAQMSELNSGSVMPVEWQAIKLQESIENKIARSLNPIIDRNDYVIEVKIGIDKDSAEDPSSKKVTKSVQSKKVKFSTAEMPKDGDDFVVFNKLGLEAPVIGEEGTESQTSEIELAQKAMIEMNDRFNLFNFMTTIDIKMTFDKSLTDKTKESIKKIVNGLSFNTKDVVPQINIQYLDLKDAKVKSALAASTANANGNGKNGDSKVNNKNDISSLPKTSFGERFKNLDIMLGLILSSVILGIVALMISKNGSKVEAEQKNENDNSGTSEDKVEEDIIAEEPVLTDEELMEIEENDMTFDLTKTDAQTLKINQTLERFRKVVSIHYNDTILMLKNWIKVSKDQEVSALRGLVETLEDNELKDLFKALTHDERSTWKMNLEGEMTKPELSKAFLYINNQIIHMMMVPSLIDDYEICDLLLDVSPETAAKFCIENPELGVVFANVLSANTIGEMFKIMPYELTEKIIEESAYFQKDEIIALMPLLKDKLLEVKNKREKPPFIKRIVDILPTTRPEIEKKLYATLLKHLPVEDVQETAMKYLPWEIVAQLPENVFKELISSLPIDFQVQYFISLGADKRDVELNRFAAKGSKGREMIDVELSMVLKNEILVKRIEGDRAYQIQSQFVDYARKFVFISEASQKEVAPFVMDWFADIKRESLGTVTKIA